MHIYTLQYKNRTDGGDDVRGTKSNSLKEK